MKRIVLALLLLAAPQWAQEKPAEKPTERVLVTLKYTNPSALQNLLRVYISDFSFNDEMKVITLRGPKDVVDAAVAMIKQLDVPPKDIDLTIYYLVGAAGESTLGTPPPKELDPVVAQLRNAFTFKSYRLLDVLALRTRTGDRVDSGSILGSLETPPNAAAATIQGSFHIRSATLAPDGSAIRLEDMRNVVRWPVIYGNGNGFNYTELSLNTDIDIKEGQKVVVGRLGISHDQALFLVLTAKVVN
ncbi:MAG TPA: hypothetical protein VLW65_09905 [Bryobacteraceae bacterium]|nr:hypothetical protein [Bryobacteraceae bacterium]